MANSYMSPGQLHPESTPSVQVWSSGASNVPALPGPASPTSPGAQSPIQAVTSQFPHSNQAQELGFLLDEHTELLASLEEQVCPR